jgi:hypothetical protein
VETLDLMHADRVVAALEKAGYVVHVGRFASSG